MMLKYPTRASPTGLLASKAHNYSLLHRPAMFEYRLGRTATPRHLSSGWAERLLLAWVQAGPDGYSSPEFRLGRMATLRLSSGWAGWLVFVWASGTRAPRCRAMPERLCFVQWQSLAVDCRWRQCTTIFLDLKGRERAIVSQTNISALCQRVQKLHLRVFAILSISPNFVWPWKVSTFIYFLKCEGGRPVPSLEPLFWLV